MKFGLMIFRIGGSIGLHSKDEIWTQVWTPDGKRITFRSDQGGSQLNLFWMPADGSGPAERLAASEYTQTPWAFSPDGKSLVFSTINITNGDDFWVLPLDGERKPYPLLQTQFNDFVATFSPDGHWIAYMSDESGQFEIYVRPFPGAVGVWQISTGGGSDPVWARSGELFYRNGDKMMAVDVRTTPIFKAGVPRLLFEERFAPGVFLAYDVTPDGKRFLIVKSAEQEQTSIQINLVLNWFEELKRRVPIGEEMTLAAGIKLGPYEIVAPIGAGGMGEVWKARGHTPGPHSCDQDSQ